MKRVLTMTLAMLMLLSSLPLSVFAADETVEDLTDAGYTLVSNDESTLAPGVTMNEVVMYDRNGDRVEMYVTTSDPSVPTVQFYANYKDNQCAEWGMQTLSEQVAAMEANYEEPFKVVAGLNASYYNVTTGAPTGAFVMEGVDVSTGGDNYAFFAVLKDGTVMIGAKGEYSTYKDQIKEAIGGYIHIVKDGAIVSGLDSVTKYPRQTVGITADGKVITMTADGSQEPKTIGLTIYEQAEVMYELGCVEALHLDGGNSATFGAVREGSDTFETVNTPSGQAERAVSNTLMIVSTAIADGTFDHAVVSCDYDYMLPCTSQSFSFVGVDATNAPASSIPESIEWALSDQSFGSIDENGKFVSNGTVGEVDIQLVDDGEVVGSKTISVVHPESITFGTDEKTVPYGRTTAIKVVPMYNNNEVHCEADCFEWSVNVANAGTLNGFDFTATSDETVTDAVITATYKYDETVGSTSVKVVFGKGSEVIFDFEDGDISDWRGVDTIDEWIAEQNVAYAEAAGDNGVKYSILETDGYANGFGTTTSHVFLATEKNGGYVKSGNYSLGYTLDRLNADGVGSWIYNYLYYTGETQIWRDVANGKGAIRLGMWVHFPEEAANTAFRICRTFTKDSSGKLYTNYDYMTSDYDGKKVSYNTNYTIPESGWVYVCFDLTAYDFQSSTQYNPDESYAVNNGKGTNGDYYPGFIQFINGSANDTMGCYTLYFDDITLDYSDVIDDRNAPVISNACVAEEVDSYKAIDGQTVSNNYLSFQANVAENTTNTNYTGLDYSTAKIYIDGVDMSKKSSFSAKGGVVALSNVYLVNGTHSVKFVISDIQGNITAVTKTLTVEGSATNSIVTMEGHNEGNETPKAGSVYYVDIKATDASQIKNIITTLQLNSSNTFEYEQMITSEGVTVSYEYDAFAYTLDLNITHDGSLSGEATLLSIPVRVWSWNEEVTGITAASQFATGKIPVIDIECSTIDGIITYYGNTYNSYITGFYAGLDVATEIDNSTEWHAHNEVALEDKVATCVKDGYTGRTYCDGCSSVIDWGTTVDAAGHDYDVVDGSLVCGVCEEVSVRNGLAEIDENNYYFVNGVAQSGWQMIDSDWYYFDAESLIGVNGEKEIGVITYEFTNGKLNSGVWANTLFGTRYYYGPNYHKSGWQTIDGKDYCFDGGYRLEDGWQLVLESQQYRNWYYFNEDGSCDDKTIKPADGLYSDRNGFAAAKDGVGLSGLQLVDGKYYYFNHHGYAQNNGTYANKLFLEDYAAYTGLYEKDGVLYYYDNGTTGAYGLTEIDGDYYFVYWGGVIKTDGKYYIGTSNCDLPAGNYTLGADGKLLNGVVDVDGTLYLYINGVTAGCGLYEVDGKYYYSYWGGVLRTDDRYYVSTSYCDLPAGNYTFGADGAMLDGVVDVDGTLYLYINGSTATCGLYEVNGKYYYSYWGGVLKTDGRYYVTTTFCDLPKGNYTFGADGAMLDGVVDVDGTLYLYINGTTATCGLYELDGKYYYSYWGGVLKTDGRYYVTTTFCDLPKGNYTFDADGVMLDGVVDVDGTLYLYINGSTATCGLYEIDGKYYYSYWGGVLKTDGRYYVTTTFCDLPKGNYTFGADGAMLDGIVDIDGTLYLYINGSTASCGLYQIDGKYYYSYWGGVIKTDGKYYVGTSFCDLPKGNYTFGADGAMLDGFVTIDGTIYYYENGITAAPGLVEVDGEYYFINWGGIVVTSQKYYVWETNGLSIKMNYTFDELGRVIG